jgi:DNA-binding NarL/FixJ family response regulator
MRILIVDDHAMVREGLKRILLEEFKDAGEAANTTEALEQIWKKKWDIALLDITMHGRTGLDVLKEIRASASKVPVLVLSAHPEEQYAVRVLKAGAAGYLTKESAPQELCRALRKVCSGGKYITPTLGGTTGCRSSVVGPTGARIAFQPRIPGHAPYRRGQSAQRNRQRTLFERQNCGHLPHPNPRKIEAEE